MPKRSRLTLQDVAELPNLVWAAHRAAIGKRLRQPVYEFLEDLHGNLAILQRQLLDGSVRLGEATQFSIFDPKPRTIHAPVFRERVLHHALMRHVGPVLELALVDDTFACRIGKGTIAAVQRAQHHARRFAWFGKLDVRQYFANVDHNILQKLVQRKFKDRRLMDLINRLIRCRPADGNRGLPIGALTSQCFANFYLNWLDRFLLEECKARGIVRYMDDVVWWCDSKSNANAIGKAAQEFLQLHLSLKIHDPIQINRSDRGISICGFRVFPQVIRLSQRRRRSYRTNRRKWEQRYAAGLVDELQLQVAYASVVGVTCHAEATAWRRRELILHPPPLEMTIET